jgi:hypothetical protein
LDQGSIFSQSNFLEGMMSSVSVRGIIKGGDEAANALSRAMNRLSLRKLKTRALRNAMDVIEVRTTFDANVMQRLRNELERRKS